MSAGTRVSGPQAGGLVAVLLLSGCGAPIQDVTIVDPTHVDSLILRVPGPSRVVFRSGAEEVARDFQLRGRVATWWTNSHGTLDGRSEAPVGELRALRTKAAANRAVPGVLVGFTLGAILGANAASRDGDPEGLGEMLGFVGGGLGGSVIGGILGAHSVPWTVRYVFEPGPAAALSRPPGSPSPRDGRGPP